MPPLEARREPALRILTADQDVEVLLDDDVWAHGVLAQWMLYAEPVGWIGWVRYRDTEGYGRIGTFPAAEIRPVSE